MGNTEIWRAVIGFEGFYEVCEDGRVRSISRTVECSRCTRYFRGRELKPVAKDNGYLIVGLSKFGKVSSKYVHAIVLEAFVGPSNGLDGCHFDGNKRNNSLSNLRWDTRKSNFSDSIRLGMIPRGERRPNAKLNTAAVQEIRIAAAAGASHQSLADKFGVCQTIVSDVVRRVRWTHV